MSARNGQVHAPKGMTHLREVAPLLKLLLMCSFVLLFAAGGSNIHPLNLCFVRIVLQDSVPFSSISVFCLYIHTAG